jgi:hypothetical protein
MADIVVVAYNTRVEDAETTTDWINIGGGGGIALEPDIVYQGTFAASRKISTSRIGRGFEDSTDTWDMTTTNTGSTWIAKFNITNPAALLSRVSPAVGLHIGSSQTVYYEYYVEGNDTYPSVGGWQLTAVNPNISAYRDNTFGSPALGSVNYFGIESDFSAGSKAENVAIDAIDIGVGLNLTGGDGASVDGTFQDFVDYDAGITTNRYGYVEEKGGILYVNGKLALGEETGSTQTAVATEFTDDGATIVFKNGYVATGYNEFKLNTSLSSNVYSLTNCSFVGLGEVNNTFDGRVSPASTEDTRPNLTITGSLGSITSSGCVYQNFASSSLNDTIRLTGGSLEVSHMIQSGSHIDAVKITTTSTSSFATLQDPTFGDGVGIYNTTFVQGNDGHALQIPAAGTNTEYLLYGLKFQGYGNTTTDSASISILETTSEVTLSIFDGGDIPTYKSAGAPVLVRAPVAFTVKGAVSGSEIRIISSSGTEVGGQESNDGVSDFVYSYSYPGYDQSVFVVVHALDYVYVLVDDVTLGNTDGELADYLLWSNFIW